MRQLVNVRHLVTATVLAGAASASAQATDTLKHRVMKKTPSASRLQAVAAKATNAKAAVSANVGGKVIRVIPAPSIRTELREASFIGTLQTELPGRATALKPGRYDLYMMRMQNGYHIYAISTRTRKIAVEAKNVNVSEASADDTSAISDAEWRTTIILGCRNQRCKTKVEASW